MANIREINAHFSSDGKYFENTIGNRFFYTGLTGPYEYLLGALAGCFYSTMEDVPHKGRWEEVSINVRGTKRDEVPTTLEKTEIHIKAKGISDKEEFESVVEKAKKECSIFSTIEHVSEMTVKIEYED